MFWGDRAGNISITFAVMLVPLLAVVGMGVDLSVAMSRRAELQGAADAGVLAAASLPTSDKDAMKKEVAKTFKANLRADLVGSAVVDSLTVSTDNFITMTVSSQVPLTIGRIAFGKTVEIKATAQAVRGDYQKAEIAMVLDNTYSMTGQKLTDLKSAANALLDVFQKANNPNVRLSLVPFSRYVNVGLGNRGKPWLSVQDDYSTTKNVCTTSRPVTSKSGCRTVTTTGSNDGVQTTSTREQCDSYTYGEPVTTCKNQTTDYKWSGCVGSRASPLDVSDTAPTNKYTGLLATSCGSALMPLTSNYAALRTAVSKMVANNETYIPAGILWGWNTLSVEEPLNEAAPKGADVTKYLIVMTDGANTLSPNKSNYTLHTGTDAAKADQLMGNVCGNAKMAGITIFTVAVGVSPSASSALSACASDGSKAYTVEQSSKLVDIFRQIASQIMTPRLTQ